MYQRSETLRDFLGCEDMVGFFTTLLYLLALCFFDGMLGALGSQSAHVVGSSLILAALLIDSPSWLGPFRNRILVQKSHAAVMSMVALAILILGRGPEVWLASICLLAFSLSAGSSGQASSRWMVLGITTGLYLGLVRFLSPLEPFWGWHVKGSLFATQKLGAVINHPLKLGPSASGWWFCLLFVCYSLAWFVVERRSKRLLLSLLLVGCLFVIFNAINLHHPIWRYHTHTGLNLINSQMLCFMLGSGILLFLSHTAWRDDSKDCSVIHLRLRTGFILLAQLLVVLSVVTRHLAVHGWASEVTKGGIVILGKEPSASYGVPSFDRLGVAASGMYGLLPRYLRTAGYDVLVIKEGEELGQVLDQAQILVIISPTEIFMPESYQRIWAFVRRGGSLLVMGDHTDIFGIMRPLNRLLAPIGVRFNFDSAYPARRAWRYSYEYIPHPIVRSLDEVNDVLQYGIGASLSVSMPAYPIVVGKYAFSDKGDYSNVGRGAFLGDYTYQRDEQLGDVVLIAGAKYGKGRVLVFGDTSLFQNVALPYSFPFIVDIFSWLSSKENLRYPALMYLSFSFFAIAILVLIVVRHSGQPSALALTTIPLALGLFISGLVSPPSKVPPEILNEDDNIAYVDASHIGYFRLGHWQDESIDGLLVNLARNGYLPVIMREFSEHWLRMSKIYVSISPLSPYSTGEIETLKEFVAQGGLALLAIGYEESPASRELLTEFGFRIGSTPLGAAPITDFIPSSEEFQKLMQDVHFMEAWPVEVLDKRPYHVLYAYKNFPIVISKQWEHGRIVVIGDTRFLWDKTLEREHAAWPGNVEFIKKIVRLAAGQVR